jgi:hypothetical protein
MSLFGGLHFTPLVYSSAPLSPSLFIGLFLPPQLTISFLCSFLSLRRSVIEPVRDVVLAD